MNTQAEQNNQQPSKPVAFWRRHGMTILIVTIVLLLIVLVLDHCGCINLAGNRNYNSDSLRSGGHYMWGGGQILSGIVDITENSA